MMGKHRDFMDKMAGTFGLRHELLRQALAECLGSFVLVMFGCGAVAQMLLSRGSHGSFLTVNIAFGFAATLGVIVSGRISGGHLNPAVTFALCLLGREPWRKFPLFFLFQTLGGFMAAAVIFCMYFDALWDFNPGELIVAGKNATAGIFATYPSNHLGLVNGVFDQVIGTAALVLCVLAIVDPNTSPVPGGLEAFSVGLVVLVIGLSMGYNSGYAVNPARDLGPRLFTALAGWGGDVFTTDSYWFFVPVCAPFLGAAVSVLLYQIMIGHHHQGEVQGKQNREEAEHEEDEEERFKLSIVTPDEDA